MAITPTISCQSLKVMLVENKVSGVIDGRSRSDIMGGLSGAR